jgi:hypothetical protein
MRNRNDNHPVCFAAEYDSKRKAFKRSVPASTERLWKSIRVGKHINDSFVYRGGKCNSRIVTAFRVPIEGVIKILPRALMEFNGL